MYIWDMTHLHLWLVPYVTCVWRNSLICVTCDITHWHMWHDSCIYAYVTWLMPLCMTHSRVWHDSFMSARRASFICVTCYVTDRSLLQNIVSFIGLFCKRVLPFICATWPIHMCDMTHSYMCDMTHSYVRHDSFIYAATWLIHICGDMTHSYMQRHDSFIYATCLIRKCDKTYSFTWHDAFIYLKWLIHVCDVTHSRVWHDP